MSELIENAKTRRRVLKHLILQLHEGKAPEEVRPQLLSLLGRVPYHEVVDVEQELVSEGIPTEEILKLCDLHSAAMKGALDPEGARSAPPGHPVHTFRKENEALRGELSLTDKLFSEIQALPADADASEPFGQLRVRFSRLADVEKHYRRKENLVFPYLEQKGITGPPNVMWGKDDEIRELLKAAIEALQSTDGPVQAEDARGVMELVLKPATEAIGEMIFKEEEILLPMCLDKLTDEEWYSIRIQSPEIGFCIYDPTDTWKPEGVREERPPGTEGGVNFPSGSLTADELRVLLNTIPFDLTFVGADDTVKYFTQGRERIFDRNRAIIGRKVQMCHPPSSVHIVQQILDDFKSGKASRAPFWIELGGKFIHIEYFAVRDERGEYLGTLEVSQDLTEKRALTGEQRLLSYAEDERPRS